MRASHRVMQAGWSLVRGFCAPRAGNGVNIRAYTAPNAR